MLASCDEFVSLCKRWTEKGGTLLRRLFGTRGFETFCVWLMMFEGFDEESLESTVICDDLESSMLLDY